MGALEVLPRLAKNLSSRKRCDFESTETLPRESWNVIFNLLPCKAFYNLARLKFKIVWEMSMFVLILKVFSGLQKRPCKIKITRKVENNLKRFSGCDFCSAIHKIAAIFLRFFWRLPCDFCSKTCDFALCDLKTQWYFCSYDYFGTLSG